MRNCNISLFDTKLHYLDRVCKSGRVGPGTSGWRLMDESGAVRVPYGNCLKERKRPAGGLVGCLGHAPSAQLLTTST